MPLPNRSEYRPGQQRRDLKSEQPAVMAPAVKVEGLQSELHLMLSSLSAARGGPAAAQWMPPPEDSKTYVEQSRKRLLEDDAFRVSGSYQQLLAFASNSALQVQPGVADPFEAQIEQMCSDSLAGQDTSRSQYMEAVAMQTMGHATQALGDPNVAAQYEHSGRTMHAWGKRRMTQQHQQVPSAGRGSNNLLPSLSAISLSQVSPYAMELAARNSMPKKRSSLSKRSKQLMHEWFEHNLHHPYPTEEEKEWLAQEGGITLEQVNNWFINTRGRKWKPMLNKLMAEKQAGNCKLYDQMVQKIEEPYHKL